MRHALSLAGEIQNPVPGTTFQWDWWRPGQSDAAIIGKNGLVPLPDYEDNWLRQRAEPTKNTLNAPDPNTKIKGARISPL
jgi:hypothetical protein